MELEGRGTLVQKSVSKLQHLGKCTYIFTMSANLIAANVLVAYESTRLYPSTSTTRVITIFPS